MKFLVTGGAGFIGSHVVEHLLAHDIETVVWDDLSSGYWENVAPFLDRITFIHRPLSDRFAQNAAFKGVTHVIHLAAQISVPGSWQDILGNLESNTRDTVQLLEKSLASKNFEGFVFASSCAVYGNAKNHPTSENEERRMSSPYALSKSQAEDYVELFSKSYSLPAVTLRFFNVFGPRQRSGSAYASVIAQFATKILRGQPISIYGDGEQTRDFVYVKDVARVLVDCALNCRKLVGTYNLCSGKETSVNHLLSRIHNTLGANPLCVNLAERPNDIRRSVGSNNRISEAFSKNLMLWSLTPLDIALKRTLDWYRDEELNWKSPSQLYVQ